MRLEGAQEVQIQIGWDVPFRSGRHWRPLHLLDDQRRAISRLQLARRRHFEADALVESDVALGLGLKVAALTGQVSLSVVSPCKRHSGPGRRHAQWRDDAVAWLSRDLAAASSGRWRGCSVANGACSPPPSIGRRRQRARHISSWTPEPRGNRRTCFDARIGASSSMRLLMSRTLFHRVAATPSGDISYDRPGGHQSAIPPKPSICAA
jgi:hypothetical protein